MLDEASRPYENFIFKLGFTMVVLKMHCAIVIFYFRRGFYGTPLCKLDVGSGIKENSLVPTSSTAEFNCTT